MNRLIFDLTKIPFIQCLISIYRVIVEVLIDQNLFTESNLGDWFSSFVQFYSAGHFSEPAAAALQPYKHEGGCFPPRVLFFAHNLFVL